MNERCVLWSRVSSQKQSALSLDHQQAELLAWVEEHKGTVVKEYKATDGAGKRQGRKTFQEMIEFIRANHNAIDVLLVYKIDRVSRNIFDWVELERLESEFGIRFVSVTQPTPSAPNENLLWRLIEVFSYVHWDDESQAETESK